MSAIVWWWLWGGNCFLLGWIVCAMITVNLTRGHHE
jgi:hypothetical protein